MDSHPSPLPRPLRIAGYQGVEINVWDYAGGGPPLLLCHCTGTMGRIWDPVAAKLQSQFRLLAVDARGHGDSAKPEERLAHAWANCGRDLLAVIDALELGPGIRAAGHSGGAAHVAYAEHARPGAFSRVALIDAIIGPAEVFAGEAPLAVKARRRKAVFPDRKTARERLASKPPMNDWRPEALDAYIEHGLTPLPDGSLTLKCPREIEAWHYELGGACDLFERLGDLQFESLLITGGRSEIAPLVEAQRERLKKTHYEMIPGAGHFIPQQMPEETAGMLAAWFTAPPLTA